LKSHLAYTFLFAVQTLLKEKYPQIAERIILMALESVNYAEDRATQILQIVQDEDEQRAQKQAPSKTKHLELAKTTTGTEQVDGATGDRYPFILPLPQPTKVVATCFSQPLLSLWPAALSVC